MASDKTSSTDAPEGTGKHFMLLHQIGLHMPGSVIHFTKTHLTSASDKGTGISVKRLLGLGAIREATPEEAEASMEYGTGDPESGMQAFPPVPFEATPTPAGQVQPPEMTTGVESVSGVAPAAEAVAAQSDAAEDKSSKAAKA
jgi:hypothetical protein